MVSVNPSNDNNRVSVQTSENSGKVNTTADLSQYYSDIAKQWAVSDKLVQSEDYSSKYYALEAKETVDNAKDDIETKKDESLTEISDSVSRQMDVINNVFDTQSQDIEANVKLAKDWATKTDETVDGLNYSSKYYANKAKDSSDIATVKASEVAETYNTAMTDIANSKTGALSEINTLHTTATNDITTGIENIEATKNSAIAKATADIETKRAGAISDINDTEANALKTIQNVGESFLSLVYPIGAIYLSVNDVNPTDLFGFGEWEQIKDTFLLACGDNYVNATTGGSATNTLTTDQLPAHSHSASTNTAGAHTHARGTQNITATNGTNLGDSGTPTGAFVRGARATGNGGGGGDQYKMSFNASNSWSGATDSKGGHTHTITVNNTGSGQAVNNMPPYLAVNVWKRVA